MPVSLVTNIIVKEQPGNGPVWPDRADEHNVKVVLITFTNYQKPYFS
jgi:hypothetical protein